MSKENQTATVEFIFVGLTDNPKLQLMLFVLFLVIYTVSLVGNVAMIILIRVSSQLHTPMYFFLSNLSFLDVCYASVVAPKTLASLTEDKKSISVAGCATQMYFFIALGTTECCLLAVMAYDRYMAICNPLLYPVLMSHRVSVPLVIGSYILGFVHSSFHTVFTFRLSFCGSNELNHFYCDITPLLAISCSSTKVNEILLFGLVGIIEIITILIVLISYADILATVLRIHSSHGRQKVFSTCASHFTGITIFHGTILLMYLRPISSYSFDIDKILAVFYTLVIPSLNPFIYSLRNKDVKDALKVFLKKYLTVCNC